MSTNVFTGSYRTWIVAPASVIIFAMGWSNFGLVAGLIGRDSVINNCSTSCGGCRKAQSLLSQEFGNANSIIRSDNNSIRFFDSRDSTIGQIASLRCCDQDG